MVVLYAYFISLILCVCIACSCYTHHAHVHSGLGRCAHPWIYLQRHMPMEWGRGCWNSWAGGRDELLSMGARIRTQVHCKGSKCSQHWPSSQNQGCSFKSFSMMTIDYSRISEELLLLSEQGMDSNLAPSCSIVERHHLPFSLFTVWGPGTISFSLGSKN